MKYVIVIGEWLTDRPTKFIPINTIAAAYTLLRSRGYQSTQRRNYLENSSKQLWARIVLAST